MAATTARAAPAYAQASAPPRARGGSCLRRALLAFAIAALLLVVLAACGWSAFLRPALHAAVDQRLRVGLVEQLDNIPVVPAGMPPITRTITDTQLNRQASTDNNQNNQGDMKDIRIHFLPGEVLMTFRFWGSPGSISTHIVARSGRLYLENTQVEGWLAQIETGAELQDTLNVSLEHVPAQDYVDSVVVGNGTLTLTLRHA